MVASRESGAAAVAYEAGKRSYQNTSQQLEAQGFLFVPMVAESTGGWGPTAHSTLKRLANVSARRSGSAAALVLRQYFEQLSIAIRAANARATLRRTAVLDGQGVGTAQSSSDVLATQH